MAQTVTYQALVSLGLTSQANNTLLNQNLAGVTGNYSPKTEVALSPSSTNTAVNLATAFTGIASMVIVTIRDVTPTAQTFSFSSTNTGTKFTCPAGAQFAIQLTGTPPTIYFDNANTTAGTIEIGLIAN